MSDDPNANSYRFTSTPHQPKQQCTARLTQAIWIERTKEIVEVFIPCSLTIHRVTTRHFYAGTLANGAPVEIFWRDEAPKER